MSWVHSFSQQPVSCDLLYQLNIGYNQGSGIPMDFFGGEMGNLDEFVDWILCKNWNFDEDRKNRKHLQILWGLGSGLGWQSFPRHLQTLRGELCKSLAGSHNNHKNSILRAPLRFDNWMFLFLSIMWARPSPRQILGWNCNSRPRLKKFQKIFQKISAQTMQRREMLSPSK